MRQFFIVAVCLLTAGCIATDLELTSRQLYQFPNATFIENLGVRPNGHLLLNTFDNGCVFTINPSEAHPLPEVIAQLPGATGVTGIAELAPDVFALSGGVLNETTRRFLNGSAAIFTLDFRRQPWPAIETVAQVPDTESLNGMARLPLHPHVVLSLDSVRGRVFRTDTRTGTVDVAFQDPMLGVGNVTAPGALGANGIKIHRDSLYFTSSMLQLFGRIKISPKGDMVGKIEELVAPPESMKMAYDDFAMTRGGVSYATGHPSSLAKIMPNGKQVLVKGDFFLGEPTSAALSRNENKLYVVTGGQVVDGTAQGGQILEYYL